MNETPDLEETHPVAVRSQPLSRAAIYDMAQRGQIGSGIFEAALLFLGARPGRQEWLLFWRHLLTLCGALFLAAGVIFFFAWNWADMHRFAKFALLMTFIFSALVLCVWKGPDSLCGRVSLLAAGLTVGALLAVYGQNYQSGAFFWELFRAWTFILLPLAFLGRQTALWFLTWLTASTWGIAYVLHISGTPYQGLPEMILVQMLLVLAWEALMYWRGDKPGLEWLQSIWLPRLMACATMTVLTMMVWDVIFRHADFEAYLLIPFSSGSLTLYIAALAAIFFWHRFRRRDLFMLSLAVFSLCSVFVVFLLKADMFFHDTLDLLIWGILITGLGIGYGTLLRHWQRRMESEEATEAEAETGGTEKRGFFGTLRHKPAWADLWAHLRSLQLLPEGEAPLPPPAGSPWYISLMLSLSAWIAALLLLAFLGLFLGTTLRLALDSLLPASLLFLGAGAACSRLSGLFARQFGMALAIAGSLGAAVYFILLQGTPRYWFLPCLLVCAPAFFLVRNASFRFIATVFSLYCLYCLVLTPFFNVAFHTQSGIDGSYSLLLILNTALWGGLAALAGYLWTREDHWMFHKKCQELLRPFLQGLYAVMFLLLLVSLYRDDVAHLMQERFFFPSGRELGVAAGIGFLVLVIFLTKNLRVRGAARHFCLACGLLSLPLGHFLPGVSLSLFGFTLSRHTGNTALLGVTGTALAAYITYYYYTLSTTLLNKSLTLAATGVVLLLTVFLARRFLSDAPTQSDSQEQKAPRGTDRAFPRRAATLVAVFVLFLAGFGFSAASKEKLREGGTVMYLELAPRDPRALLLGDYMALRFSIDDAVTKAIDGANDSGRVIVTLDAERRATFARLDDGSALASGEHRLRYRKDHDSARVSAAAFFFQEGDAQDYEKARYGEIHVDEEGANLLTHLLDEKQQRILPGKRIIEETDDEDDD